jgi:hypothetical protein
MARKLAADALLRSTHDLMHEVEVDRQLVSEASM